MIVSRRPKRIPLHNRLGEVASYALVDTEDFDRAVAAGPWHISGKHVAHDYWEDGKHLDIKLHRLVMGLPRGRHPFVDHINGDERDNRKSNLRVCSHAQNSQNIHVIHGVSKYRGVTWHRRLQKWQAGVRLHGKLHYLGYFTDEDEAGRVAAEWRAKHMPFSADALVN